MVDPAAFFGTISAMFDMIIDGIPLAPFDLDARLIAGKILPHAQSYNFSGCVPRRIRNVVMAFQAQRNSLQHTKPP